VLAGAFGLGRASKKYQEPVTTSPQQITQQETVTEETPTDTPPSESSPTSAELPALTTQQHVRDVLTTGKYYGWKLDSENTRSNDQQVDVRFRTPTL